MLRSALAFAVISTLPVPLIGVAAIVGGIWPWLALLYLTLIAFAIDELIAAVARDRPGGAEFPAAVGLLVALGLAHFGVLGLVVIQLGRGALAPGEGVALFLATGLFLGQVGNSNAHELIHRPQRMLHTLGKWVYITLLFGHHVSAHPLIHHRHVASDDDPNSARSGESYYRFAPRAWLGSFRAGYAAERARRPGGALWSHPYAVYCAGAAATLALAGAAAGWGGIAVLLGLAGHAQSQLLMSDYVQHYGLRRERRPDGRLAPVAVRHSWNAPHWFSGHMMLNAPRHSDHHAHPGRLFAELVLPGPGEAPMLPRSLPAMSVLALVPPLWRGVMDPRVAMWRVHGTAGLAP